MAEKLDLDDFERQMGPFALIQRPPDAVMQVRSIKLGVNRTMVAKRDAAVDNALSLIFDFDDLNVTTLPPVLEQDQFMVGRLPDCDVVIDDPSVSKRHAQLRWDALRGMCTVEDLGSSNGTWINKTALKGAPSRITDGSVISFGNVDFYFLNTPSLHQKLLEAPPSARSGAKLDE